MEHSIRRAKHLQCIYRSPPHRRAPKTRLLRQTLFDIVEGAHVFYTVMVDVEELLQKFEIARRVSQPYAEQERAILASYGIANCVDELHLLHPHAPTNVAGLQEYVIRYMEGNIDAGQQFWIPRDGGRHPKAALTESVCVWTRPIWAAVYASRDLDLRTDIRARYHAWMERSLEELVALAQ